MGCRKDLVRDLGKRWCWRGRLNRLRANGRKGGFCFEVDRVDLVGFRVVDRLGKDLFGYLKPAETLKSLAQ